MLNIADKLYLDFKVMFHVSIRQGEIPGVFLPIVKYQRSFLRWRIQTQHPPLGTVLVKSPYFLAVNSTSHAVWAYDHVNVQRRIKD